MVKFFPMILDSSNDPLAPVLLHDSGGVVTLTLNRPASFNAIDLAVAQALRAAVDTVAALPHARVLLLRGAGRSFCSGGDVAAMHAQGSALPAFIGQMIDVFHGFVLALNRLPIPVIAQVHGAAAGGGFSLALACDLVLATRSARFVVAYPQLGTSSDGGLSWQLTQRLGATQAFEVLTLHGTLSAEQALQRGLIHAVVDDDAADTQAQQWAQALVALPALAVAQLKGLVHAPAGDGFEAHLSRERAAFLRCVAGPDFAARVAAFTNKKSHS